VAHRIWALERMQCSEETREAIKEVQTNEYASSDESEAEKRKDGSKKKRFFVKRLKWESEKLTGVKQKLDKVYRIDSRATISVKRYPHPDPSTRLAPNSPPL